MSGALLVVCAAVLNGAASVFLKLGAQAGLVVAGSIPELAWGNKFIIIGICCFALNVLVYFAALRLLPLSIAYPTMVALSFLVVATLSAIVFNEAFTLYTILGFILIVAGIALISLRLA